MSTEAASTGGPLSPLEQIHYAREILQVEGQALLSLAGRLEADEHLTVRALHRDLGRE